MRTYHLLVSAPLLILSTLTYAADNPQNRGLFTTDNSISIPITRGQYIEERHNAPDKYLDIKTNNNVSPGKAAIYALRIYKLRYDSGSGTHLGFLEISDSDIEVLMTLIEEYLDLFTIADMEKEYEICNDFIKAYESGYTSMPLDNIESAYNQKFRELNRKQQEQYDQFLRRVASVLGDDALIQLEYFIGKFSENTTTLLSGGQALLFKDKDKTIEPYLLRICNEQN